MKILFINIIFITLYILSYNHILKNLEEIENPQNINTLLDIIPSIFDKLTSSFFTCQCTYYSKLTYTYFKAIESHTNIKYFLNQKDIDIPIVIDNIISLLNVTNKHYINLHKYLKNFLSSLNEEDGYNDLDWVNQIIASTGTDENDKIAYGVIFAIKKGNKIDIIFCYGLTTLNSIPFESVLDYSEYNNINNGNIEESHVSYVNSVKSIDRGDRNLMIFLRLAGIKALGNYYGLDIPYPRFNGFY